MRALLAVVAAGALVGCDWSMGVDVHTTVTPAAFAAVGTGRQELMITETGVVYDRGPASYRVAVLCAPPPQPVTFRAVIHEVNGCGQPGQVTAWLRAAPEAVECGSWDDPRSLRAIAVPSTAPQASAPVFEGGGRCPKRAEIALELVVPPAAAQ